MPTIPLVAMVVFALLVVVAIVPAPLWISRALRRGRRLPALPPAPPESDVRAPMRVLLDEGRKLAAMLPPAIEAADDVLGVYGLVWIGQVDGDGRFWGTELRSEYEVRVADAVRAVDEWVTAMRNLPETDRDLLAKHGVSPDLVQGLVVEDAALMKYDEDLADEARVGALRRSSIKETRARLRRAYEALGRVHEALARTGASPYR